MSKAILGTHLACLIITVVSIFIRAYTDDIGHWSEPAWVGMIVLCLVLWVIFALATVKPSSGEGVS